MEQNEKRIEALRVCPRCGNPYAGYPALSRVDNAPICPDCGTLEALERAGMDETEQEQVLAAIRRHTAYME